MCHSLKFEDFGCRRQSLTSLHAVNQQDQPEPQEPKHPWRANNTHYQRVLRKRPAIAARTRCRHPRSAAGDATRRGGPASRRPVPQAFHGRVGIGMQLLHAPVGHRMHVFPHDRLHGPSPRLPRPHSTFHSHRIRMAEPPCGGANSGLATPLYVPESTFAPSYAEPQSAAPDRGHTFPP